jgi:hypothetical protein
MFTKAAFASAIILASAGIGPASAASCSEWLATCRATVGRQTPPKKMEICDKEGPACKARCKAGNKIWIGPDTGRHYPVTSCD